MLDVVLYYVVIADEDDDKESGIHVSDVEEMEFGGEGSTPVDAQVPKELPGMASSGRRGRTFSTGKEDNNSVTNVQISLP